MNVNQMIAELKAERDSLTAAMSVLENIARSRGKRRGRPPAWLAGLKAKTAAEPGPKRVMSASTKKKMAIAQRRRWAAAKAKQS